MADDFSRYLHKHTVFVTFIVVSVFLLLAGGEYYLYRKQMQLNLMISEGLMQVKEELTKEAVLKDAVMMDGGKMYIRKNGSTTMMNKTVTLPDGSKVSMNGEVQKLNGTKTMMKDGETFFLTQ